MGDNQQNDVNNFTDSENPVLADSPFNLHLWSIKETKDDKKVADVFPYNEDDAGEGTFFSLVRSKIKSIPQRDEDGYIYIDDLSLFFEDVVRKSAWQDEYIIGRYLFDQINSKDFSFSYEDSIPYISGRFQDYELTQGAGQLINFSPVEQNPYKLKSGFYKGEVASYYNESRPAFTIKVRLNWRQYYLGDVWAGSIKIYLRYFDENNNLQEQYKIIENPNTKTSQIIEFELRTIDKNGMPIEYNISTEFLDNNSWTTEIINSVIKYGDENYICTINNLWTEMNYEEYNNKEIEIKERFFYEDSFFSIDDFVEWVDKQEAMDNWKNFLEREINYLKVGQVRIICGLYTLNLNEIENWLQIIPFLSVIEKKPTGDIFQYHFRIKTQPPADSSNPFYEDMVNSTIENATIITTPYLVVNRSNLNVLGKCAEQQFFRKGCAAKGNSQQPTDVIKWTDDLDIDYLNPLNKENPYTLFYIGEPTQSDSYLEYDTIKSKAIFSNSGIKLDQNQQLQLKNFCIYITDILCLDTNNVNNAVPYYYKVSIDTAASFSNDGVLNAELCFNSKDTDFINVPSEGIVDPNSVENDNCKKHLLLPNDFENNFIEVLDSKISVNKDKIILEYEGIEKPLENFIKIYKNIYN